MLKSKAMLAAALLLCVTLTGCTVSPKSDSGGTPSPSDTPVSSAPSPSASASLKPAESSKPTEAAKPAEVSLSEQVVLDQDGIKVTVTGLDLSASLFGPELTLLIENGADKALTFQVRDMSVNGFMLPGTMFSSDVAAGKKANDGMTFMTSELEKSNIRDFASIEFKLHIFDSENWENVLDTPAITLTTSLGADYQQPMDESGTVLFEEGGIRVLSYGLGENAIFGPEVRLLVENNSEQDITLQGRDVSVNGFMVSSSLSSDVPVGKKAFTELNFFSSELDENGITEVNDVELIFHIFDSESWKTIKDTPTISLTF